MDILDLARSVFANDLYASKLNQISIECIGDHTAECSMQLTENHCNARGVAMGGVLSTLADFATAVAANSDCLQDELQWVSLDATIHYLSPAHRDTKLIARCTPLKLGRTIALYQTTIESLDKGRKIAIVETTMMHV